MVDELFTHLSELVESTPAVALGAAFVWGILSVVLSPCHLGSIPLIAAYIGGGKKLKIKEAFGISLMFSLGILITIALIGVITAMMGRMFGDTGSWITGFVGVVFIFVGIYLMEIIPVQLPGLSGFKTGKRGALGALILGLVFGVALGPCTFAFMAPVMAVSFAKASTALTFSIMLLLFYGIGHCLVIAIAGASTRLIQKYLNWTEESKGTLLVKRICGVLVIVAGVYIILQ